MRLLSDEFLKDYPDTPEHMNQLANFVFLRTYSRWLPKENRRETWKEAVTRAVEYNVSISVKEFEKNDYSPPIDLIKNEAEVLFDNIFNLRQFLSGRTHWVGGAETKVADKFPLANFNCSFVDVTSWDDIPEIFYLLLLGTGVGIRGSKENIAKLAPIRTDYKLIHSEYNLLPKKERLEVTKLNLLDNGYAKIYVGDSKEGWVDTLKIFFDLITNKAFDYIKNIKISYNSVRPRGEKLKTFGGTASGHEPLKEMFINIDKVFKNELDTTLQPIKNNQIRPIHLLDIVNLIGNNVIVGGVRRTAEIFLCDDDDWEVILAKYGINGIWNEVAHKEVINKLNQIGVNTKWLKEMEINNADVRPLHHRRMSNNSIIFNTKPSDEYLDLIFSLIKNEGEPGFFNLETASRRRPNVKGVNPCGEVLLDSYGVCNLTTINVMAFVKEKDEVAMLDYQGLMQAQALSVRAGIRMTCLDLELPRWDEIQKRDRLTGASMTGWKDAMCKLGYGKEQEMNLLSLLAEIAHAEAVKYSHILRIPLPLLTTTIKPEGTLSQIANGVSSGLHVSHAPYYIRRIRINANDPLAQVAIKLNWTVNPEIGTPGDTYKEQMNNTKVYVIDFPVKANTDKTRVSQSAKEQLETYFTFQNIYTAHNSSNTISIKPDEWEEVKSIILDRWDEFIGVSFLPYNGGTYSLAPYEEITEEEYIKLSSEMKPFDVKLLKELEKEETEKDVENIYSCENNVCPIF